MEIWKKIDSFENYEVSNVGNVKSLSNNKGKKEKQLKGGVASKGYLNVGLNKLGVKKTFITHRLVAIAFIPNPENKPQVNHINGIKSDNRVENLEWCTCLENIVHSYDKGLNHKGEAHKQSKLKGYQVIDIRLSINTNLELSKTYGVTPSLIRNIKLRKTWKHI